MIVYGVFYEADYDEVLQNLYLKRKDAQEYLDSRKQPEMYFIEEVQVY